MAKNAKSENTSHFSFAKEVTIYVLENVLVPTFMLNQFTSLQNLLECGMPTIRNKLGWYGQGQTPQDVDDRIPLDVV
jgi:hypothetical protein